MRVGEGMVDVVVVVEMLGTGECGVFVGMWVYVGEEVVDVELSCVCVEVGLVEVRVYWLSCHS